MTKFEILQITPNSIVDDEKPSGYLLVLLGDTYMRRWQPDRSFNCLFEFLVDGKLIYATIYDETYNRGT